MDEKIEKTIKALKSHGFDAEFVATKELAKERILQLVPAGATVGLPGTRSVRDTGVAAALVERGHVVYDHWTADAKDNLAVRKAQITCDVLLTSTNALTVTGELVNKDGVGNRVAPMIFGPKLVVVVAGVNKIVPDLAAAEERIRKIAGPRRAAEYNLQTPCVKAGECQDCNHPMRICRATVILHRKSMMAQMRILIVGEELGN